MVEEFQIVGKTNDEFNKGEKRSHSKIMNLIPKANINQGCLHNMILNFLEIPLPISHRSTYKSDVKLQNPLACWTRAKINVLQIPLLMIIFLQNKTTNQLS